MRKHTRTVTGNIKVNKATAALDISFVSTKLNINLSDRGDFRVTEELLIDYRYLGHQVMILDLDAPGSLTGIQ